MSNEKGKAGAGARMSGPDLIFTTATQASAAGGSTQYAFVSCFGAKAVTFIVRTVAGVPTLTNSTVDIDPGVNGTLVTGIATENQNIDFLVSPGSMTIVPGSTSALYASTTQRFWMDRIALRATIAASATGVSCWAVTQWD